MITETKAQTSSPRGGTGLSPILRLGVRVVLLLVAGTACGLVANLVLPQRIAWVEDWAHYVEALAYKEGLMLAPLAQTKGIVEEGSHIVFDARPLIDYEAGHIPASFSLPHDDFEDRFDEYAGLLTPEQPILAYCSGTDCDDGLLLLLRLREQGFTNVVLFAGGWEEWSDGVLE